MPPEKEQRDTVPVAHPSTQRHAARAGCDWAEISCLARKHEEDERNRQKEPPQFL